MTLYDLIISSSCIYILRFKEKYGKQYYQEILRMATKIFFPYKKLANMHIIRYHSCIDPPKK